MLRPIIRTSVTQHAPARPSLLMLLRRSEHTTSDARASLNTGSVPPGDSAKKESSMTSLTSRREGTSFCSIVLHDAVHRAAGDGLCTRSLIVLNDAQRIAAPFHQNGRRNVRDKRGAEAVNVAALCSSCYGLQQRFSCSTRVTYSFSCRHALHHQSRAFLLDSRFYRISACRQRISITAYIKRARNVANFVRNIRHPNIFPLLFFARSPPRLVTCTDTWDLGLSS